MKLEECPNCKREIKCVQRKGIAVIIEKADFTADTELEREAVKLKLLKELGL